MLKGYWSCISAFSSKIIRHIMYMIKTYNIKIQSRNLIHDNRLFAMIPKNKDHWQDHPVKNYPVLGSNFLNLNRDRNCLQKYWAHVYSDLSNNRTGRKPFPERISVDVDKVLNKRTWFIFFEKYGVILLPSKILNKNARYSFSCYVLQNVPSTKHATWLKRPFICFLIRKIHLSD